MKTKIILLVVGILLSVVNIRNFVVGDYEYEKSYQSYWNLAEKASTITKKIEGVDKFVNALENGNFKGKYNAIWLETPDNSFDMNFEALKSLQQRLHDIEKMDIKSFEYQTAIQQITAQEQGEAKNMIGVFESIWWKQNHILLWDWIGFINWFLTVIILCTSGIMFLEDI